MVIAMPHENGKVNAHFGSSKEFIIYSAEGNKVADKKIVANNGFDHNHEGIAGLLKSAGVEVVITGGIGRPMINALQTAGFQVVTGASGAVDKVAEDFLNQKLVTSPVAICGCGHGHEHGHGHGHGHHHGHS